jgi:hypothetical protein
MIIDNCMEFRMKGTELIIIGYPDCIMANFFLYQSM